MIEGFRHAVQRATCRSGEQDAHADQDRHSPFSTRHWA